MTAAIRTGPSIARHKSVQDVRTPLDLLEAVALRFGDINVDLAATVKNAIADRWLGPGSHIAEDSLAHDWATLRLCVTAWLNPPFGAIAPWAAKCAATPTGPHRRILLLVPASVGSNWWAEHVHNRAAVKFLSPRVRFVGHDQPFPKDLALCCYGEDSSYALWRWRS